MLPGIVAGVGGYGNCLGLPNIGGEAVFDATYLGNPLVNALCVGVLRHEDLHLAKAAGTGNRVILYGARTGGDGIGGVSVLASETFDEGGPAKRPSVQVGDPFMEKLLIECTLELFAAGVVTGIQDLGGAGLSCATSELASAGDGGMHVDLDLVPLRDSTLAPEEILMSESQERMMAVVEPADVDRFLEICAKWDVEATDIGEVTDTGRLRIDWHGEQIVDVPPRSVAHDGPTYHRPFERPASQDALQADRAEELDRPEDGAELRETLLRLAASPNLCDKSWITDQYDRYVRGNTVLAQPSDSGMVRIDEETGLGVAVVDRLQRPVRPARPVRRRPARAGRELPQRRDRRGPAARRLRLPQLRLARGPGGDVAVRGGLPRPQGRLRRARHPGHRRQRQPLQPDRRDRDPADAGRGGARRDRRRHPPYAHRLRRRGRPDRAARRDPRGALGLGVGPRRPRPPRRAAAAGGPRRPSAPSPRCSPTPAGRACSPAATTSPTAGSRRRWSRRRCATASAPRSGSRATRSSSCSRSRRPAPW